MTFPELQLEVQKAQVGNAKVTDIATGEYTLSIEGDAGEEKLFLVAAVTNKRHSISVPGLASLRMVTKVDDATKIAATNEVAEAEGYSNLQTAMLAEDGMKLTDKTKFTAVHRLRILDQQTGLPIYRNNFYNGYGAYLKGARIAGNMPAGDDRNSKFGELNDALRATGVKANIATDDKTLVLMPVFTVE